jgi:type IV secretion system protein VirD4
VLNDIRRATFRLSADVVRSGNGEKRTPPVLFALDECANSAPIPDLPSLLSEAGGQGLQLLCVFQDMAQMSRLWPADSAGMLSLFGSLLVLSGIKNRETLELLSLLAGDHELERSSVAHARSRGDSHQRRDTNLLGLATSRSRQRTQTVTTSTEWRREIPPEQIAQMPQGVGLLWRGASYKWVPLVWWDQHPVWRCLAIRGV